MHNHIGDTLDSGKNFWKEMQPWTRNLGLIPNDALHGFMPKELKKNFSSIAIATSGDHAAYLTRISAALLKGFRFTEVSEHDVILAVSHFK